MVDDNFIGNKRNNGSCCVNSDPGWRYPFRRLSTEASVDLTLGSRTAGLMVAANFTGVFW